VLIVPQVCRWLALCHVLIPIFRMADQADLRLPMRRLPNELHPVGGLEHPVFLIIVVVRCNVDYMSLAAS
jgi:hypothetical protein